MHKIERRVIKPVYHFLAAMMIKGNPCTDYELVEADHNCGYATKRMTERGLELRLALDVCEQWKADGRKIIEVGAVTPYYFSGMIKDVLDAYDKHEAVNLKMDLLDFDFSGYNVLSISTIEHVGLGDYQLEKHNNAMFALDKILSECEKCLIVWGMGYNKELDKYVIDKYKDSYLECYARGRFDNNWKKEVNVEKLKKCKYSDIGWADALAVIRK